MKNINKKYYRKKNSLAIFYIIASFFIFTLLLVPLRHRIKASTDEAFLGNEGGNQESYDVLDDFLSKGPTIEELTIEGGKIELTTDGGKTYTFDLTRKRSYISTSSDMNNEVPNESDFGRNKTNKTHKLKVSVGGKSGDIFRIGSDVVIRDDEVVDGNITVIGSDIIIKGFVKGDVVAIDGDVLVTSTGRINGDVSSIGGKVEKEPGAVIGGDKVETPAVSLGRPHFQVFTLQISLLIAIMLFAVVLISLAPNKVANVKREIAQKTLKSLLLGYLYIFAIPFVFIILLITIIGIPVAILILPLAIVAAAILGFTALSAIIGVKFLELTNVPEKTPILEVLVGGAICLAIPLLGIFLASFWSFTSTFGNILIAIGSLFLAFFVFPIAFGAAITTLFGTRPKEVVFAKSTTTISNNKINPSTTDENGLNSE